MPTFMNAIEKELNSTLTRTENGALQYQTSGKALLDINFAVSSMRNETETEICDRFVKAYYEDKEAAILWLFFASDVREGLGERRLFRVLFKYLAENHPEIARELISLVPEYSRWDNIFCLMSTKLKDEVGSLVWKQLTKDAEGMMNNEPISLLAKWMPSINASSRETKALARELIKYAPGNKTEKAYRKTLSTMRKYLDVVEIKTSSNRWSEIDYSKVPSKANLLYNEAFWKHDPERRLTFLDRVKNGEEKINGAVNFPHDIVHQYGKGCWGDVKDYDETLEQLWKALPDYVNGNGTTLMIRDGSGSMETLIGGGTITALDVATALTIYFSERCNGEFKDKFITFGHRPKLVDMSNCSSLKEKLELCYREADCSNTDIKATFDLILRTAVNGHMKQEDMPQNVCIVSDMEFDNATWNWDKNQPTNEALFETIRKEFEEAGYKMPRLIFWNTCSRTNGIPLQENELGVALVSGFSAAITKMVLSSELDPYKVLLEQLYSDRYKPVREALK